MPKPKLDSIKVSLDIPVMGKIEGVWKPDEIEMKAAWELYVELVTRITVVPLAPQEGLLREALASMYGLFGVTRSVLRQSGPSVARPKQDGTLSLGYIAVAMLNGVLRPVLAKWHPLLLDYEQRRPATVSSAAHEDAWERNAELREAIGDASRTLTHYAELLAQTAKVPSLVKKRD
jgi:hypothetical protein